MATVWHETVFPVPAHAAAITGESMEESRAATTVMDKIRRMLQGTLPLILMQKQ
jgi:phosphoglycerate dehydrogenase-like enzyme